MISRYSTTPISCASLLCDKRSLLNTTWGDKSLLEDWHNAKWKLSIIGHVNLFPHGTSYWSIHLETSVSTRIDSLGIFRLHKLCVELLPEVVNRSRPIATQRNIFRSTFWMKPNMSAPRREHATHDYHDQSRPPAEPCRTCTDFQSWMKMQGKQGKVLTKLIKKIIQALIIWNNRNNFSDVICIIKFM